MNPSNTTFLTSAQRRPEVLVPRLHLLQHRRPKLRSVRPVRYPPTVAMLQRLRSTGPIPCPDPLALPVTQLQHLRCLTQSQAASLYPPHHFHSAQLFLAQSRPPQSSFLLAGGTLKGDTSNVASRGHFQCGSTQPDFIGVEFLTRGSPARPPIDKVRPPVLRSIHSAIAGFHRQRFRCGHTLAQESNFFPLHMNTGICCSSAHSFGADVPTYSTSFQ